MKTVFILSAGASSECGAPSMADFIARARQLHRTGVFGPESPMIQDVLNAASSNLRGVHAKSAINQGNIEEIFSAIDMGHLIGRYGGRDVKAISGLAEAVRTAPQVTPFGR